jgi:hypothetical protein
VRALKLLVTASALILAVAPAAVAGPSADAPLVSSGQLVVEANAWDGKAVSYTGEAITQAMHRGDHAWVHVNDDAYHLKNVEEGAPLGGQNSGQAVWLPSALADQIRVYGDYTHQGDVVEVVGTFNAACPEHGGDMDIHATDLRLISPGRRAADPVRPWKAYFAFGLSVVALVVWRVEHRMTSRARIHG